MPPEVVLLKVTELPASILTVDGVIVTDGTLLTVTVLERLEISPAESLTVTVTE